MAPAVSSIFQWLSSYVLELLGLWKRADVGHLTIPSELILMIVKHLDKPALVSFSLTCRTFFYCYFPTPLRLATWEKRDVLLGLARDNPDLLYCYYRVKLHEDHPPLFRRIVNYFLGRSPPHQICDCDVRDGQIDEKTSEAQPPPNSGHLRVQRCALDRPWIVDPRDENARFTGTAGRRRGDSLFSSTGAGAVHAGFDDREGSAFAQRDTFFSRQGEGEEWFPDGGADYSFMHAI